MIIPADTADRVRWLAETRARLRRSIDERSMRYGAWRTWYLHGGMEWGARYNKIRPGISTLASYLFSPRSVRFGMDSGPVADSTSVGLYEAVSDRLRALWTQSGADGAYAHATLWSLVYGSEFLKFGWASGQPTCVPVSPANIGVWRDDLPGLAGQQALLHAFRLDADTVRAWMAHEAMPEGEIEMWMARFGDGSAEAPAAGGSLVIGSQSPILLTPPQSAQIAGGVADWGSTAPEYESESDTPTLEVEEIWAWDDALRDWRVFQVIERVLILSSRANPFVKGRLPFTMVVPDPVDRYLWGVSTVASLIPLQAWREKRMNQLDRMFARQANPPMVFSGFMGGVSDEKAAAVMRRGGLLANSQTPSAKVDLLSPNPSALSFSEIGQIDEMFNETLGLNAALLGATSGERGGKHAEALMGAGAGRLTGRMMAVEACVAEGAALLLEAGKRFDPTVLADRDGTRFVLAQVGGEVNVEVAAHSASPLFAGQAQALATSMVEMGVADPQDWLDIADPPLAQTLKQRFRARQDAQKKEIAQAAAQIPVAERGSFFASIFGARKKH